ncbi:MAG: hypothetical protein IJB86_03290 [Clostridia bacterium]|nr:hypothetical protein [Clostridia bacterium]
MTENTTFFLGANTPFGFHSLFSELYDPHDGWRAYIIKGGPGTGKSTMMKRIADLCEKEGVMCEKVHCASDPESLDALIFDGKKISIVDGTAPHVIEPQFPGAVEKVLYMDAFRDDGFLQKNRAEIIRLWAENSSLHKKSIRFLQASESLSRDVRRIVLSCTDTDKAERYASRLASRKFGTPRGVVGTERKRFLSAVTPDGIYIHYGSIETLCDDVIVIDDPYGSVSSIIVGCLRRYALGSGLDVISCPCPLHPDCGPEHLIVPEIGFAVVSSRAYHRFVSDQTKVNAGRFTDNSAMKEFKSRVAFSKKTQKELVEEAVNAMKGALKIHDELEEIYKQSMDFEKVNELTEKTAREIIEA